MKYSLIIISGLIICLTITNCYGQNVNIPDANFKAYLVGNADINTNGDGEIQISEANGFTGSIDCSGLSISYLIGISAFTVCRQIKLNFST